MAIEIKNGFLKLTIAGDRKPQNFYVKGNVIVALTLNMDGYTELYLETASRRDTIYILETQHEILDAIAESYKQAARR